MTLLFLLKSSDTAWLPAPMGGPRPGKYTDRQKNERDANNEREELKRKKKKREEEELEEILLFYLND